MYYSATENAFFAGEFRDEYERAGTWPADAFEVSEEVFAEFSSQPPSGYRREPDSIGQPSWVEIPEPPARSVAELHVAIDRSAGVARERFVSPGYLVEQEYKRAEEAARNFAAAGYPSSDVPSAVSSWATAKGWTNQEAADDIIATAELWYGAIDQIREIRLTGKAAVQTAEEDQREATAQQYIHQLHAMAPA
ncbi:hypothetical protein [Marinobacter subterrani]|uniref:Uncharacterized protein n=1 Tax=Marinobacter subterrani TaxID=1658765 RepID=A0A0J7J7Q7_9GAMM|nr:hypothetical protein [Marinobacter subterrani]KMQ73989.1 hypothetical protein Msub_10160 [Marinobacter subterrani]